MLTITSQRTELTPIELIDLKAIHELHSFPETNKYNALGIPTNIEETKSIIKPWIVDNKMSHIKNYTFKIQDKESKKFIGLFGLKLGNKKYNRAEVWFKIHPNFWNNGYATETLKSVLNFGFDTLKLHRITAGCAVDNIGSAKALEKAGLLKEGRFRQVLPLKSGWSDNFEYAILETDNRQKY